MLLLMNEIVAAIAIPILLLSLRGFAPHLWRGIVEGRWTEARTWLFLMVLLVDVKGIARMGFWDLVNPIMLMDPGTLKSAYINAAINTVAALSGLAGLKALHMTIPEDHDDPEMRRSAWSMWTAPFYPSRFRIGWIRR